jgi:RNA polymerase sigma-70 factor (ECF subfamily)
MTGDLAALSSILAKDVVVVSDGGGVVKAALKPVHGRDRVARLIVALIAKAAATGDVPAVTPATLNGLPALLVRSAARPLQTVSFDLDDASTIRAIYLVANPEKLRHLV